MNTPTLPPTGPVITRPPSNPPPATGITTQPSNMPNIRTSTPPNSSSSFLGILTGNGPHVSAQQGQQQAVAPQPSLVQQQKQALVQQAINTSKMFPHHRPEIENVVKR